MTERGEATTHARRRGRAAVVGVVAAILLAACAQRPIPERAPAAPGERPTTPIDTSAAPAKSAVLQRLTDDASALKAIAQSPLTQQFLAATTRLPEIAPRTVYQHPQTREYFSAAAAAALPEAERSKLGAVTLDEYRYWHTKYGSPLAYLRALDVAAANGLPQVEGKRILDFGYGAIGHLRLLASLGANVTGVDPDKYLAALYSEPADEGAVPTGSWLRAAGSVTLVHSPWPKDKRAVERVGRGYDLILSKNTLKRGYLKPERKADKRQLIDLGVSDEAFLRAIADALNPGGLLVIYNLAPKQAEANEPFKPQADGRSPFSRAQFEKAGLTVMAFDANDDDMARKMAAILRWDRNEKGEVVDDLGRNLFGLFTVVRR